MRATFPLPGREGGVWFPRRRRLAKRGRGGGPRQGVRRAAGPIETASLSESGAEKIHQGVCLRVLFPVRLEPGKHERYSILWSFNPLIDES